MLTSVRAWLPVALALSAGRTLGAPHSPRSCGGGKAPQQSVPVDIAPFFNNKAFGKVSSEADFNGQNESYSDPDLGASSYTSTQTGIVYSFPGYTGAGEPDNVVCSGETIEVSPAEYFSASFLIAGDLDSDSVSANVTFTYTDNSTSVFELRSQPWWNFLTINRGELIFPYRFTSNSSNYNTTHIFERTAALTAGKTLSSITLPTTTNVTEGRLHVFSASLWQGSGSVNVQSVRPTQKWLSNGAQVVEVTLNNAGSECIAGDGISLSLTGAGFSTIAPGQVKRLCPGDQKTATIGVQGSSNGSVTVDVALTYGPVQQTIPFSGIEIGFIDWSPELDNLANHESPEWFNDAKFGIFIHWGPYSVTGWGNSSPHESYAEWFWWYSTHHPQADGSDFYDYRLRTYGQDWAYDDTFSSFNASSFDPKMWVDLIADAGAKYFVLTTKHHDGFALFDTGNSTNRSAIHYGPKRDLLGELFDAAETYQPTLKRGTYFSLPEWFNPDFGPYGFDQFDTASTVSWPGIEAKNPYTGVTEPYTGRIPVDDFITDVMVPQMETLAYTYSTDIMWCDCGAANGTAEFAAAWWNTARTQDRQVTINSRCGIAQAADFDTPEYETFSSAQRRKWESNEGMDPYSYGYNRATPDDGYMNASTIIYTLIDMVSKNGNLLLDFGPRADGTIVQREADNLREAGAWIIAHGEAIYNTTYWFVQSEIVDGPDVRFTQTDDAFYIIFLEQPVLSDGVVSVTAPVPILDGDLVSLLAVDGGESLSWETSEEDGESSLLITVSDTLLAAEVYGWVFKVAYQ
ncbi:alpha-L-fucosidase [Xylariales sp. PMI_506]|nr:alpha-L-fucosidase [Xylariales sp. PMI_506]